MLTLIAPLLLMSSRDSNIKTVRADTSYSDALGVADRFLAAWEGRRLEEGKSVLSPKLLKRLSKDDLSGYLVGLSNPHHAGFELGRGKRISKTRIEFPVRLYTAYTHYGQDSNKAKLVLVDEENLGWRVQDLP